MGKQTSSTADCCITVCTI